MWCQPLSKTGDRDGQKPFLPPSNRPAPQRSCHIPECYDLRWCPRGDAGWNVPRWTNRSPTTLTCSLVCERAWAGSPGLPSPAISRLTSSQTGRSAARFHAQLPMELAEEAVVHIHAGIEVGMALVATGGAKEQFAAFAWHPLTGHQGEPHPLGATPGTIL